MTTSKDKYLFSKDGELARLLFAERQLDYFGEVAVVFLSNAVDVVLAEFHYLHEKRQKQTNKKHLR